MVSLPRPDMNSYLKTESLPSLCVSSLEYQGFLALGVWGEETLVGGRGRMWGKRELFLTLFSSLPFSLFSAPFPPETPGTQASASVAERRGEGDNICHYFSLSSLACAQTKLNSG